jgi:predicted  nucleic acid-binding Zn-ribbon protein
VPARESPILKILIEMRDELRRSNSRLEVVEGRLENVDTRLEHVEDGQDALAKRLVESEMRLATELVATRGVLEQVRDTLMDSLRQRDRVDEHERRIADLEHRSV